MVGAKYQLLAMRTVDGEEITMTGLVAAPDASVIYKETVTGTDPDKSGKRT